MAGTIVCLMGDGDGCGAARTAAGGIAGRTRLSDGVEMAEAISLAVEARVVSLLSGGTGPAGIAGMAAAGEGAIGCTACASTAPAGSAESSMMSPKFFPA